MGIVTGTGNLTSDLVLDTVLLLMRLLLLAGSVLFGFVWPENMYNTVSDQLLQVSSVTCRVQSETFAPIYLSLPIMSNFLQTFTYCPQVYPASALLKYF